MCSSPKPKRSLIAVKHQVSGAIFSRVNREARLHFAQCANTADERRFQITKKKQASKSALDKYTKNTNIGITKTKVDKRSWAYWLVSASFSEIIAKLSLVKSDRS